MARNTQRKNLWLAAGGIALVLSLSVILPACSPKEQQGDGRSEGVVEGLSHETVAPVAVTQIASQPFSSHILLVGEVDALNNALISSETSGVLRRVVAHKGAQVHRGDTLLHIDSRMLEAQLATAEASLKNAELDFEIARKLYESGQGISESDYHKAGNALSIAEAQVQTARVQLENCFVLAPFAGTVAERHVDVGELVAPGTPLIRLVQEDRLKVTCGVPENQAYHVQIGNPVSLSITEANFYQESKVSWVGTVIESRSRTLPIEISLHADRSIRPGMVCEVRLQRNTSEAAVVVPISVVQKTREQNFVFVVEQGRAQQRSVVLGYREGDQVEILQGLSAGESLVVSGFRNLVDGQPVKVQEAQDRQ